MPGEVVLRRLRRQGQWLGDLEPQHKEKVSRGEDWLKTFQLKKKKKKKMPLWISFSLTDSCSLRTFLSQVQGQEKQADHLTAGEKQSCC